MNNRVVQCIVMLVMYRGRISTSSLHTRDDSFFALMATGSDTHVDTPTHPRRSIDRRSIEIDAHSGIFVRKSQENTVIIDICNIRIEIKI